MLLSHHYNVNMMLFMVRSVDNKNSPLAGTREHSENDRIEK